MLETEIKKLNTNVEAVIARLDNILTRMEKEDEEGGSEPPAKAPPKKRKAAAKKKAAPEPEIEEDSDDFDFGDDDDDAEPEITQAMFAELTAQFKKSGRKHMAAVKEIAAKHGSPKGWSGLDKDKYAEAYADLKALADEVL